MLYPLSQTQMGIYITCMNTQEEGDYNLDMLYILDSDIDLARLAKALDAVVECHPYIKSRIIADENGDIVFEDHTQDEYHTQIQEINDIEDVREHLGEAYDLMHDPLFRFEIYKTSKGNYLYIDIHHIIFDGMSYAVLRSDLNKAYAGEVLEAEPKNGFQIAEEEAAVRASHTYQEAKEWYAKEFGGATEVTSMPLPDIYAAETEDKEHFVKAWHKISFDKTALEALCEKAGVRESMVFTAAFGYTLSKYSGDEEALYTTVYHGRGDKATRRAFCMMTKTLPIYHNFKETPAVVDLLRQTSNQAAATRQRTCYSFADLHNDLGIQSDVCFVYQGNLSSFSIVLNDKVQQSEDLRKHRPGIKFSMQIVTREDGYYVMAEYSTSKYSAAFIENMVRTYNKVLTEMLVKENLIDIECVDESQTALLDSFNHAIPDYEEATVLGCFKKAAAAYPDNEAAVCNGKRYTYRELDELTDKVGAIIYNKVKDCGKQEPVVSILINRNEGMFILPLAAIKAGCAYQPLDPSYPQDRLNFMVKDADATLVIADDNLKDILNEYEGETLLTSKIKQAIDSQDIPTTLPEEGQGGALFILLYTSGSTGVPKGVMLEHRNLVAFNRYYARQFNITSGSKIAGYASFGFDANMMDVFCSLMNGATFHVIDENIRLDLEALHNYFEREGISLCFMTTQVGVQYLENYPQSASLKNLVMGGEKLRAVKPDTLNYNIYNGYGPSETTCGCALFKVEHYEPNIPIGIPTDTVQLFVMDKNLHRLPWGAAGELIIAGKQVGRGYLNRPDKTAEAFFTWNGMRAYHSGDIVRYREDGNIEFVGRKDGQVKIRGFRIELKEVEAVIRDFPGIKDVTVQAFDDPNGGKYIAAYIVSDESIDVNALNLFILDQKPPYMVPAVTMQIDAIPLTINQKVDKKALPKPEANAMAKGEMKNPQTEMQKELKALVAGIVNNDQFSVDDILGYIGLTSISSIKLATQIFNKFGIQVNTKMLAKTATIESIEQEILSADVQNVDEELTALTEAPLSNAQMGVYAECVYNADSLIYNIPVAVEMPAGIEKETLKKALLQFAEAHPAINSRIVENEEGNAIMQIIPDYKLEITEKALNSKELEAEKKAFVRPFILSEGPLYRFEIVETEQQLCLLADFHHLISDGASIDLFMNQLCEALDGKSLKAERYDYLHFATDQKISDENELFFEQQLGGIEESSQIIPDVYDAEPTHLRKMEYAQTDLKAVEKACHTLGVTPAAFYLAAFAYTVSRYVAEETVGFCTISNGRSNSRIAETMGMFVNTLPIVCNVDSKLSVSEYVKTVAEGFSATIAHEDYPFARVAEKFGFVPNIMFGYQVGVISKYLIAKGELKINSLELDLAKFPISVFVEGTEENADIKVEYDESLYSPAMMAGLSQAMQHVVEEMLRKNTLAEIEICNDNQIALLDSFNHDILALEEAAADNAEATVLGCFKKAAATYPDNIAAVFKDKRYTYRELDELTDKIGALIYNKVKDCGMQEPVVSILINRNENMFILPLAAMKAGCAYQPLDPSYPQDRLNFMVKDADAALVFADEDLKDILNEYDGETILTSNIEQAINSQDIPTTLPGEGLGGASLFILLYTSGSTGVPKGVMLEHRNLVAFIQWYRRYYDLKPESNVAAYASFGFDACMMDMYPALTTGATVHIIPEEIRLDLVAINDYFEANNITHSFMTTQVGVQFLLNIENNDTLHHLSVGGEKLVSVDPAKGFNLHNCYGPTECTIFTTIFPVTVREENIPIGRPVGAINCYVVDKNLHRLPCGAAGELIIVGKQVGRGYLNRPDKTAEAFFTWNGQRAYHSGDIVRYREDGNIEFVGRKDGQVKIRGFRIELKEVEAVIREFPGINDVTVQAFDDPNGGKFIAAYIVSDSEVNIEALNDFIRDQKPPYMVPAVTMQIDAIPLNVNQKVDKKALPKPELQQKAQSDAPAAPLNKLEEEIKSIIAGIVKTDDFSITEPLAYVGLTSISSIRLATLIYKRFGVQINSKVLIKEGTLQSIENEILQQWLSGDAGNPAGGNVAENSAVTDDNISATPLTFAQTGVYYDIMRNPGSTAYNVPTCYTFPEGITAEMLQKATVSVLSAHKVLGSHFEIQGADVVQTCPEEFIPEVNIINTQNEEELKALKTDFVKPFNPTTGPLYRTEIISFEGKAMLLFDALHLVVDGASISLLQNQLTEALEGVAPKAEEYTYFNYSLDEQKFTSSAEFADSEKYFDEILKTVDGVSNITEDLKPQDNQQAKLGYANCAVDINEVDKVAKNLGVTPASLFLAAAYYTVSRYTNTEDVCLCTISNGRSNVRISDTVGMFVNTVAIASHIKGGSVKDFILQTANDFSQTLEHENYPFAKVSEKFDIKPTLFFQYQVGVIDAVKVKVPGKTEAEAIGSEFLGIALPKFKFTISIDSCKDGSTIISIQYDDTLYSAELAQGFANAMAAVLRNFMADTSAPLKGISMLTDEQAALISTFHETKKADVPVLLYHKLFEKSVAEHGDDVALVALNPYTKLYSSLTFNSLNEHMNRIALSLIKRGVKPGDRVAILLPRTSRLIMSQYGILKAGGAYIPCDPKYPTERINLILEDSESKYIITTADRLQEFPDKAIDVEELLDLATPASEIHNPEVNVKPDDLAYLIYTSGSTGRPKGVQLMHKGVCNYHHPENIIQSCLKNECHAALGITTISFDMSVWETGSPLMLGKTLVLVGDDDCNDPNRLAMLINDYGIDCMTGTTSRFMQLLESPAFEEAFRKHIHLAYQGGEGLSMALLRKLQSYPNVRIFNGYGPTETIANSHASELTHDDLAHIGKPCVNYTNFILDNDGNELPVGVVGELVIGGRSVAKGYNNLPEQTASRFVEYKGERVYKSGDYARWLPDGNVMVLGRKDNQVKLRGLRIELGEVETAITKVEGVKNVAVMIKKLAGKDHLCAYFTADRTIEIEDMKEEISQTLTHYMVPTAYLQMPEFPLTPNGKTDVKRLPEPQLAKVGGNYVAPRNKAEEDFCHIFETILELDKVSAADSFFDLGGSSLTATRVVIEATNLGYSISYSEVFDNPTAQKLAALATGETPAEIAEDKELTDYDYTKINALVEQNTLDSFRQGERLSLGNVILTGANGYLGIHILHNLLENHLKENPELKVYCLVRHGRNGVSSEARLRNLLFYYFEKSYKEMLGKQLIVIDGDVTNPAAFSELEKTVSAEPGTYTLINCAAVVKHFSEGTEIEDINIGGLQNCVDFCLKTGAQLIQTSTDSTAGQSVGGYPDPKTRLSEQMHYIGQSLTNKYTRSKFIAERIVLEAIVEKGLVGKVMRLGNLSPRAVDGEFQINFRSNSSMGYLHVFQMLGVCGYSANERQVEFSPIDEVAESVLRLSLTPKECVIFHPVNNHIILLGDVIREMADVLGVNILEVEDDVFQQKLQEAGQDPEKAKILQSMLAYSSRKASVVYLQTVNNYTNSILLRLGFHWNVTSWDYVQKFISAIAGLDFFEDKR